MNQTDPIPVITARGSHYDVGQVIGSQMKDHLAAILVQKKKDLPRAVSWDDARRQSQVYLGYSQSVYPQYVDEFRGMAAGAEMQFEDLFTLVCEELWDAHIWQTETHQNTRGCTDLAARGKGTKDGSTLLAHTNDELPDHENHLVILKIKTGDEPEILGISSGGRGISAGYNAAGIGLTGNQVNSNDCRPGVPRMLMVRAILGSRRLGEALEICALPERASNYNNIISDISGEIFSMEGSATDVEAIYIEDDILVHTNHYLSPAMRCFEADRSEIAGSLVRYHRAKRLLKENYGEITQELMMSVLRDHTNFPNSICMHGNISRTAYSIVIQLDQLCCWIGKGRPCETSYVRYQLEPWADLV